VVLWSRRSREADKVTGLFTRDFGRVTARATSAARSTAKFAALTEPFVEADIALYTSDDQGWGKIVGGHIRRSFPALRLHVGRVTAASWICEVVQRLTPVEQASPEKFDLVIETLAAMETASSFEVLRLGFAVRFLSMAGFGLDHREAWQSFTQEHAPWANDLRTAPLAQLAECRWSSPAVSLLTQLAGSVVTDQLNRPLAVNRFRQMTGVEI
jgi:DNA repair protein RecO (recombination protein O)